MTETKCAVGSSCVDEGKRMMNGERECLPPLRCRINRNRVRFRMASQLLYVPPATQEPWIAARTIDRGTVARETIDLRCCQGEPGSRIKAKMPSISVGQSNPNAWHHVGWVIVMGRVV